jgi:phage virion morphogenesis protein
MAGTSITLSARITGAPEIARRLDALLRVAGNRTPTIRKIGAAILFSTQRRFEREQAPDGTPWRPLAPATLAARGRGGTPQILRDSGRLYASLTYRATNDEAAVGTNVVYGAIHQLGGRAGRGGKAAIPARPFLGLSADDVRTVGEIVTEDLAAAFYGRKA